MPTFAADPSSTYAYTTPAEVEVELFGAGGGNADAPDGSASGGNGGYLSITVSSDTALSIAVGEGASGNAGGASPVGDGGNGGGTGDDAGGGGAPAVVTRSSDGAELGAAGGGGGAGGGVDNSNTREDYGGGGGARGGAGGGGDVPGQDAEGTGVGGDGAFGSLGDASPGNPGGTAAHSSVTVNAAQDGGGNAGDAVVEVSFFEPSAPANLSQTVLGDESVEAAWDGVDAAVEYEVEVSEDGGAFTAVTTTTSTSVTYDATPDTNTHQFRVRSVNPDHTSAWVTTDTVATDPANLTAVGSTFDPIELSWDSALDATEYQVLRATSSGTVASDYEQIATTTTESYTDDVEPSTEYFYRVQAVYPGVNSQPSNEASARRKGLLADVVDETTVSLGWQAHSDSTGGWLVEARRQYDGTWSVWRELATLDPAVKEYEAGTSPDTTVQFRVTPLKEETNGGTYGNDLYNEGLYPLGVGADTPGTATVTTASLGLEPRGVQASGWHVEITRPDGNGVVEPTILADIEASPRLKGKPEVTIPVPRAEKWLDEEWERQPMRVWRDGERLPIERFDDARIVRGSEGDYVEIVGRGGTDLNARYQDEVRDRSAHNVMRDVLDASGYAYTVDPAPQTTDEPFGTLSTESDFAEFVNADQFNDPFEVTQDGTVTPRRTAYMTPLDEIAGATTPIANSASNNWSATNAIEFDVSAERDTQWTVNLDYAIPSEHLGLWFRAQYDFKGFLIVKIDGTTVRVAIEDERAGETEPSWRNMIAINEPLTDGEVPDLDQGQHTIRVETTGDNPAADQTLGPAGVFYLDCPVLFDTREWDPTNFANTLTSELLDGPPGVYSAQEIDLRFRPIQRTTGASLSATVSDTTNEQAIGVGPIETDIQTNANATAIDRDFGESTRDFIARLTLGGADGSDQMEGPNEGVEQFYTEYRTVPQTLSELTVTYDAIGSPSITESIDNPLEAVLTNKAERANCIWEIQWDDDLGEPRVVVTQVGQRTDDADPDLASYNVEKNLSREISGATIYGRTRRQEQETFVADSIGTSLANNNIQGSSERVYDASGTVYVPVSEAGDETSGDYEMEYQNGSISIETSGDMVEGEKYLIDYDWHPVGSEFRAEVDFDNHLVETLNGIRSDPAAQEAASFLVDSLDVPQWEAEVTIPQREAGFDLVDAIAPSQLPTPEGDRYEVRSVSEGAGEISLTLGARLSAGEVIRQIEQTLGRTAREV
jgi:hypothetical protein